MKEFIAILYLKMPESLRADFRIFAESEQQAKNQVIVELSVKIPYKAAEVIANEYKYIEIQNCRILK